jgi:hemolysin activation/secretion protein
MKKLIVISCVTASLLLGVTLPNIGNIEAQVQPPKELFQEEKPLIEIGGVEQYAPVMSDDTSGKKIFVQGFTITHNNNLKEEELQQLLTSYTKRELSFNELLEATSVITKAYRNRGYFVARAYLPKQNIQDDIVEISVIEGYYGDFVLENNSTLKDNTIQEIFDNAKAIEDGDRQ